MLIRKEVGLRILIRVLFAGEGLIIFKAHRLVYHVLLDLVSHGGPRASLVLEIAVLGSQKHVAFSSSSVLAPLTTRILLQSEVTLIASYCCVLNIIIVMICNRHGLICEDVLANDISLLIIFIRVGGNGHLFLT